MNGLIIGIGIMLCIMSGLIIHDYQGVLKWEEVKDDKKKTEAITSQINRHLEAVVEIVKNS